MKPAISLIIFTVFSGFGFGLLFWLNLHIQTLTNFPTIINFLLGFLLSFVGLVSSTFHLGNPQRALLAFTQWRSSWLSREAILALFALVTSFINAIIIIFFKLYFYWLGLLASGLCLLTIFATAMIYTQMKTVPRWNMKVTPALFLLYATVGSSIILKNEVLSFALFILLGIVQILTWKLGDQKFKTISNINSATGLSNTNKLVRLLEPPHTGSNYLLKEMVHIVAQKHIYKLRLIAISLLSLVPAFFCLVILMADNNNSLFLIFMAMTNVIGTLVSRWLFFSEAEHVVGLYYDR